MKPALFVAAATVLSAGAAQAQSNVTVYGLIDMSVNYAQFGSTATRPSQHIYT
ncbi:MAG TPA: porin, partial [Burkholderiaceae bacterium]